MFICLQERNGNKSPQRTDTPPQKSSETKGAKGADTKNSSDAAKGSYTKNSSDATESNVKDSNNSSDIKTTKGSSEKGFTILFACVVFILLYSALYTSY